MQRPDVQSLLAQALQRHQGGQIAEAERLYLQILQADPGQADAWHLLGVLALQRGQNSEALERINKAIAGNNRIAAFHNSQGNALQRLGHFVEAVAAYRRALRLDPGSAGTCCNLAVALQALGQLDEAATAYAKALALTPGSAQIHNQLGTLQQQQGKLEAAAASYRAALRLKPSYADAYYNLGTALQAQDKLEEAADAYGQVLARKPACAEAHSNLGTIFSGQGRMEAAAASFARALALKPDYAAAALGQAIATIPVFTGSVEQSAAATHDFLQAIEELEIWSKAHPGALGRVAGTSQPYHLLYRPQDITQALCRYGAVMAQASGAYWKPSAPVRVRGRDRIRLLIVCGYVQARHPVWNIVLKGLLAHLDRTKFEVVLFHTGLIADAATGWAQSRCERFVQGPKPVPSWLDAIAQEQPDIIFYPEVGMDAVTCALAALRLAPLQAVAQGNAMTTGFPTMDLYFSGALMEGADAQKHYREKLVRLPGTGLCLEWNGGEADAWHGPQKPADCVRFALWLQPLKFDPGNDALYARIAKAVGACEFWLVKPKFLAWTGERFYARLAAAFRAEGLDPEAHLRLGPWLTRAALSGLFDGMDVYLDSPAFSGCTTAWQALHRGLPIVTLEGEFLRQRQTAGLLRQTGLGETIASSRDGYVEIAARLAEECRDPVKRAARREVVRNVAAKLDNDLCVVRAFEKTLIEALRDRA
jgi:protein O-GlcNAc transferase